MRTTLDDAGAVRATASYDPWGVPQGELVGPFGFTGELHHGEQVYLRARWYAPGWGTFPTRDPFAGFPEMPYSLHAYQYAYSAPTMWTDPSGELALFIHGGYGRVIPNVEGGGTYAYDMANRFVRDTGFEKEDDIIRTGPGGIHPLDLRRPSAMPLSYVDQSLGIQGLANTVIAFYDEHCGQKPIFIYGVSRGGATAQLIAAAVYTQRPDVSIDLMATIAPVNAPDHPAPSGGLPVHQKMPNVKQHLNFLSEQGRAVFEHGDPIKDWPDPIFPPIPEVRISGAMNWHLRGTSHRSIVGDPMGVFRKMAIPVAGEYPKPEPDYRYEYSHSAPNTAWERIGSSLFTLYQGYGR